MKSSNAFIFGRVAALSGLLVLGGCGSDDDEHHEMSTATDFTVTLKGSQTIPTGSVVQAAVTESGSAMLKFDSAAAANLTGSLTTTLPLTGVTAVHLHRGYAGQNGGVVNGKAWTPPTTGSTFTLSDILLTADLALFQAGGTYLNIHSGAGGNTQIRGQVLPVGLKIYRTTLGAATGVTTTASGVAAVTVNEASGDFTAYMTVNGLGVHDKSHIHAAAGSVLYSFAEEANAANPAGSITYKVSGNLASSMTDLKDGKLYVNVHSQTYPASMNMTELTGLLKAD